MIKISEINKLLKEAISEKENNFASFGQITTKYYDERLKNDKYIKANKIYNYLLNNYKVLESFTYLDDPRFEKYYHAIELNSGDIVVVKKDVDHYNKYWLESRSWYTIEGIERYNKYSSTYKKFDIEINMDNKSLEEERG